MEITIVNLVLATATLIVGLWAYARNKAETALLVGVAFGFFAVSHLLTLVGLEDTLNILIIAVRILGYLTALVAVYRMGIQKWV